MKLYKNICIALLLSMSVIISSSGCAQTAASTDVDFKNPDVKESVSSQQSSEAESIIENSKIESSIPESSIGISDTESSISESGIGISDTESSISESGIEVSKVESSVNESNIEVSDMESSILESSIETSDVKNSVTESNVEVSDPDFFKRTAFVGNSVLMGLDSYKIITDADFYCKEGLTVYGVMHDMLPKQKITVIEQIVKNKDKYDKLFIMFGTNETGLYDKSEFINDYEQIIDILQKEMPDTKIYIQSILPVTAERSKQNIYDLNNKQIEVYNKQLKELAKEKNIPYIDVASVFKDKNGCLPKSSSPDGVHLNPDDYLKWSDYLQQNAK